jgi:hypothetical protein
MDGGRHDLGERRIRNPFLLALGSRRRFAFIPLFLILLRGVSVVVSSGLSIQWMEMAGLYLGGDQRASPGTVVKEGIILIL